MRFLAFYMELQMFLLEGYPCTHRLRPLHEHFFKSILIKNYYDQRKKQRACATKERVCPSDRSLLKPLMPLGDICHMSND